MVWKLVYVGSNKNSLFVQLCVTNWFLGMLLKKVQLTYHITWSHTIQRPSVQDHSKPHAIAYGARLWGKNVVLQIASKRLMEYSSFILKRRDHSLSSSGIWFMMRYECWRKRWPVFSLNIHHLKHVYIVYEGNELQKNIKISLYILRSTIKQRRGVVHAKNEPTFQCLLRNWLLQVVMHFPCTWKQTLWWGKGCGSS